MIDSHAHINDQAFMLDYKDTIKRAKEAGVSTILIPGWDIESSKNAIEIANEFEDVYAAIGIHPENLDNLDNNYLSILEELSKSPKVVAIGEIGLDYHYTKENALLQLEVFKAQLHLAHKLNLPVVIHSRDCTLDMLTTLKDFVKEVGYNERIGVMHSYSGSKESMMEYLKLGFYISFSGPVTYKNANSNKENAVFCPIDKILVETDSPYLTPVPLRGKRNEPAYVSHTAREIASLRDISLEKLDRFTTNNFNNLFLKGGQK